MKQALNKAIRKAVIREIAEVEDLMLTDVSMSTPSFYRLVTKRDELRRDLDQVNEILSLARQDA